MVLAFKSVEVILVCDHVNEAVENWSGHLNICYFVAISCAIDY